MGAIVTSEFNGMRLTLAREIKNISSPKLAEKIFGNANPIEHMAQLAGTIPYELTCAVSKRVPRMYIKDGKVYEKELLLRG